MESLDYGLAVAVSAPPPAAAQRVADELLRRFGLGTALQLEVAPGGLLNQNLFATTARGAYFLKGYRYADPEPIRREHRLVAYVRDHGLPALAPLASPTGDTFLRVGGRFWAVFPRLTGEQPAGPAMTPGQVREMGHLLGRIHLALAALPPADAARFPARLAWDSAQAAAAMAEYEQMIARRPALDPFDQHTLSSFAYRRTLLAGGVPPPSAFATLPAQVLHGDFHDRNLFFAPSGAVESVIDWELASVGPRAWEVVRALDVALALRQDVEAGAPRVRAFLHGYASAVPLTPDECAAMPELYRAARVHSLWVYEEHYRKGSARTDRVAMEDLETLHWLAANRQSLAQLFRETLDSAPAVRLDGTA